VERLVFKDPENENEMIVVMPRNAIKTLVNLLEPVTQTYQKESPEHNKAKKIKM
jgi:hypothetical protein